MEDILDISKNIQGALSEFASGPMSEVTDLTKQVRDNFLDVNSVANIEITAEDKLAKMDGQLGGIKAGYEAVDSTLRDLHMNLNGITDTTELGAVALDQQANIQQRIEKGKEQEAKLTNDLAEQQRVVLIAEQARAAVPFESDEYKEYTEQIKEANLGIIEQQGHITGLQAQQAGLKSIQDGYLETIIKEAEGEKTINEITATRRELYFKNLELSSAQLDLIEKQKIALQGMGENLDNYIKKYGGINDAVMRSFDTISDNITGLAEKIPLFGGIISAGIKKPLQEAAIKAQDQWQSFTEAMRDDMSGANGEALKFGDALKKNFGMLGGAIGGMGKAIMSALFNPLTLILGLLGGFLLLLKMGFDQLVRLEDASREFRFNLGDSALAAADIRKNVEQLESQFSMLGLRVEDFYRAATSLREVFASSNFVSKDTIAFVGLLNMATGVSEDAVAGAINNLTMLGMTAEGQAEGTIMALQKMSEGFGVSFAKVMDDVANASEDAMLFAQGSAKALAIGAIEARRLGRTLDDAAASASALLDFESSIPSQMKASVLLGRQLDFGAMRRLAWAGDTAGLMEEQNKMLKQAGGLSKLNRIQEQGLAEAMGVSVQTLYEMEKTQKQNEMLRKLALEGNIQAAKKVEEMDKAAALRDKLKNMSAKELAEYKNKELEKTVKTNMELEGITTVMNGLKGLFLDVQKALAPVVGSMLPIMTDLVKDIAGSIPKFSEEVEEGGKKTKKLTTEGEALKATLEGVLDTVKTLGEMLIFAFEHPVKALGILAVALIGVKVTMGIISGLASVIGTKLSAMAGAGAGPGGGKKGGGIFGSIANFINSVKPSAMLAAAAAVLIVSGAMYVMAEALVKLKDVGIGELGIMAGGLLLLVGAVAVLGMIMKSGVGAAAILAGATALAILGVAMIPLAYALKLVSPALEGFASIVKEFGTIIVNLVTGAFTGIADIITSIGDAISGVIDSIAGGISTVIEAASSAISCIVEDITKLSTIESDNLFSVAGGIAAIGAAMIALGAGKVVDGAGNFFGGLFNAGARMIGVDEQQLDPMDQLVGFIDKLSGLNLDVESLKLLGELNIGGIIGSIPDGFEEKMEIFGIGLFNIFNTLSNINTKVISDIEKLSSSMPKFLLGLSKSLPQLSRSDFSKLKTLSTGLNDFFEPIADTSFGKLRELQNLGPNMASLITGLDGVDKIPTNIKDILSNLGEGLNIFFEKISGSGWFDGDGIDLKLSLLLKDVSEALLPSIKAFTTVEFEGLVGVDKTLESLGVGLAELTDSLDDVELDQLTKLVKIKPVADIMMVFSDFSFNQINTGMQNLAISIQAVATSLNNIDVNKIKELKNVVIPGAQGPVGSPGVEAPSGEEWMEMKPKFMMTEMADLPVVDVAGGSLPPSDPFVTTGPSLAEVFSTPLAETQVQQIADTGTTSLAEVFSSPPPETQVQQVAETGTTSLAEAFASPSPELVTEQKTEISILKNEKIKDSKKVNEMVQPIVDVVGKIYTKFIPDSIKQKLSDFAKNEYFNLDEDHSMEAYKRSLGVNESVTNNILGDMGIMSAKDVSTLRASGDKVTENEFTSSSQFERVAQSTGILDQIMAGILRKDLPTKLFAEGQLVGINTDMNRRMYKDEDGFTQVEETSEISVTDVSEKLANNVSNRIKMLDEAIINNTTLENDSLNKLLESRRQQLTDEGRLVVKEIQSQVEPINTELQEKATAPTSAITKIADFTTKLVPQIPALSEFGTDQESTTTPSPEVEGFETINIQGKTVFVEEITRVAQTGAETQTLENRPNNREVVTKLDELIKLMRTGGIAVNMDGRKVSRRVAASQE